MQAEQARHSGGNAMRSGAKRGRAGRSPRSAPNYAAGPSYNDIARSIKDKGRCRCARGMGGRPTPGARGRDCSSPRRYLSIFLPSGCDEVAQAIQGSSRSPARALKTFSSTAEHSPSEGMYPCAMSAFALTLHVRRRVETVSPTPPSTSAHLHG